MVLLYLGFTKQFLTQKGAFVDASPISVRLMKKNSNGNDIYLGGYLDKELRHNHKWKLTDNILLAKPGSRYDNLSFKEILAADGKYYIDLFYNNDLYRYNFEVKNKELVSTLSDKSKAGSCWIEREYVGLSKYDGYRPTAKIAGKSDNIRMMVKSGSTTQGMSPGKAVIFTDGQKISASINFKEDIKTKYMYRLTEYILTLKKGDKIIAQSINMAIFNGYSQYPGLIYNPGKTVMVAKEAFTHVIMDALSKLPAGTHKLKLVYELASGKDNDLVGLRTITYKAKAGNPTFTKWAKATKEQIEMSRAELGDLLFLRSPSNDWALYQNNCGRLV